ncbi:MAG: LytTR family DNA-binding domain-containing protein [Tannerellaceae bacterium]|nr:LytTR family DNA-binding domain-containing protein [Tannerellaceae bacterium]
MNCIIVDDEPLAREVLEMLVDESAALTLSGCFNGALQAMEFLKAHPVDLIFLDIRMPKISGLEFARLVAGETLIIFTTAYTEYAIESYEIDAIDYLVKPVEPVRFAKAVEKAVAYHELLKGEKKAGIELVEDDHIFGKADRRYFKVNLADILFIEGLKDYSILQCSTQRIITRMNLKNVSGLLPSSQFLRVNKSYIVNTRHIESFDNNDIFIGKYEIAIGASYRDHFFESFVTRRKKG